MGPTCAIIVGHNSGQWLGQCLASLARYEESIRVIYVDNDSQDNSCDIAESRPGVVVLRMTGNYGFGVGCNIGALYARVVFAAECVAFVNPDVAVASPVITNLARLLSEDTQLAALGPLQRELRDGQALGFNAWTRRLPRVVGAPPTGHGTVSPMPADSFDNWLHRPERFLDVSYVNGAMLVVDLRSFWGVGGFSPAFFLFFEEVDLCRRLRNAGLKVQVSLDHEIGHEWGGHATGSRQVEWLTSKYIYIWTEPGSKPANAYLRVGRAIFDDLFIRGGPPAAQVRLAVLALVPRRPLISELRRWNGDVKDLISSATT